MEYKDDELLSQVRELRSQRGWSQNELALALGVSQGHMSKVLSGKVTFSSRLYLRVKSLLSDAPPAVSPLEERALVTLRASARFRALVVAALDMHDNA